jgi:hypothetical protein
MTMQPAGQELIREYVDTALAFIATQGLMQEPLDVPEAMIDFTRQPNNNWVPWKAIASTLTEDDIRELEQELGIPFPQLYVDFLQYRHFYSLDDAKGISFMSHPVRDWKTALLDLYGYMLEPSTLIRQGYIPFAYNSEMGHICFDTSQREIDNQDCAVVLIRDIYADPAPKLLLYSSFFELLLDLQAAQKKRDATAT